MTFSIEIAKQDLEAALRVASITVGSGTDLSGHYLFRLRNGQPEVLSYDMRMFSRAPLKANVDGAEGDAFTVEAWRLDKWVSSVGDGVLTLTSSEKGEVVIKGPRSRNKLRSLDPSKYPYWDGMVSNAATVGEIVPGVLHRALSLSRSFVSGDENRPELCQVESHNGDLQATNRRAVSSIRIRDLSSMRLRLPGKEIGNVLKFLSEKTTQEQKVVVQDATRAEGGGSATLFLRPDGSYVGVSRPTAAMPQIPLEIKDTTIKLNIDVDEFMGAVRVLLASAPKGHEMVGFSSQGGALVVSMPSDAGGEDTFPLVNSTETNLQDIKFSLGYSYVKMLSDLFGQVKLEFGVHLHAKSGYVSYAHDDPESGAHYYTVFLWQ